MQTGGKSPGCNVPSPASLTVRNLLPLALLPCPLLGESDHAIAYAVVPSAVRLTRRKRVRPFKQKLQRRTKALRGILLVWQRQQNGSEWRFIRVLITGGALSANPTTSFVTEILTRYFPIREGFLNLRCSQMAAHEPEIRPPSVPRRTVGGRTGVARASNATPVRIALPPSRCSGSCRPA